MRFLQIVSHGETSIMKDKEYDKFKISKSSIAIKTVAVSDSNDAIDVKIVDAQFEMNHDFTISAELRFEVEVKLDDQSATLVFSAKEEIDDIDEFVRFIPGSRFDLESETVEDESTLESEIERLIFEGLRIEYQFENC